MLYMKIAVCAFPRLIRLYAQELQHRRLAALEVRMMLNRSRATVTASIAATMMCPLERRLLGQAPGLVRS